MMKKRPLCIVLAVVLCGFVSMPFVMVSASSLSQIGQQIEEHKQEIEEINDQIMELQDKQDLLDELIADLNAEIVNTMTSISMKEDEITLKEEEIVRKELQILQAQEDYEAAKRKEEEQYQAMKLRVKYSYENENTSIWDIFMNSHSLGDMLNRIDYMNEINEHDQQLLEQYEQTKQDVQAMWDNLVLQKTALEQEKVSLEQDKEALLNQKKELDKLLEQKKRDSENYAAEIAQAQREANAAKKKLQQEEAQYKKLLEEQKRRENAANQTYQTTNYTTIIENANGSDLGKKIAKYACQYIGNPYVMGGTSLTNGADCSGFIYRVYMDFGYQLTRTSYEQRSVGTGVSYDQAQPGDIICYDGHVGIYIGGGKIVHASSAKTGIKVSNAPYRPILSVRRIV
ncbi:MAG: C40 family peptidase [Lachnospiraceae bacterium]|nr:C40 family peptidase [Lachnospiraceae bacterium]